MGSGVRMPGRLVRPEAERVLQILGGAGVICGSLRRGCEAVGDVDVVLVGISREDAIIRLTETGIIHEESDAPRDRLRIPVRWRTDGLELDLWTPEPGLVGACVMHATGPGPHNMIMRRWALSRGLNFTWAGVRRLSDGVLLGGKTEEETCRLVGWPLATPEHRERWWEWVDPYTEIMNDAESR